MKNIEPQEISYMITGREIIPRYISASWICYEWTVLEKFIIISKFLLGLHLILYLAYQLLRGNSIVYPIFWDRKRHYSISFRCKLSTRSQEWYFKWLTLITSKHFVNIVEIQWKILVIPLRIVLKYLIFLVLY